MKLITISVLLFATQLVGCATESKPYMMYRDGEKSIDQIARIRVANVKVFVKGVDGEKLWTASGGLLDKSEVHVLPGRHSLWVSHTANETGFSHDEADTNIPITAEAGHMYTVAYSYVDEKKVAFFVRDHGTTYDTKCSSIINKPNMLIYIGHEVPKDCY